MTAGDVQNCRDELSVPPRREAQNDSSHVAVDERVPVARELDATGTPHTPESFVLKGFGPSETSTVGSVPTRWRGCVDRVGDVETFGARCFAQATIGAAEHCGTHGVRCCEMHGVVPTQAERRGQITGQTHQIIVDLDHGHL